MQQPLTVNNIAHLSEQLSGYIIMPDSGIYDEARQVWNGMIDKHPSMIVRVATPEDVATTVNYARNNQIPVSVRGGGHNVAGNAVIDGGIVIDLSDMTDVRVDENERIAHVQGGATIGHVDTATQAHGLATPLGVFSETGIAGLTLGGGFSWLRRKYGLACDALISAQLVTAEGDIIEVNQNNHSDLLWGLKGGGGNFGIVTRFDYQLYPIGPDVYAEFKIYPKSAMREGLQVWREWQENTPDEISAFAILGFVPAMDDIPVEYHHQETLIIFAVSIGDPNQAEQHFTVFDRLPDPIANFSGVMSYAEVQTFFDEDYPAGEMHYYWKSRFLANLDDDAIDTLIAINAQAPSHHSTIDLWQLGGALSRIPADATAFGDRSAPFLLGIESNWEIGDDDAANINWARDVYDVSAPFGTEQMYLNFPGFFEEGDEMVNNAYGDNMHRLRQLKQVYDPTNFFNKNQNIKPVE